MTIVKADKDGVLLEQYGNKYIRIDAGWYGAPVLFQVKITDEDFEKISTGQSPILGVFSRYDDRGLCTANGMRDSMIKDYIRAKTDYSDDMIQATLKKLREHKDVFLEFHNTILAEDYPKKGIVVEGYTAEQVADRLSLTPLGAYNYLIYLREKPEEALDNLENEFKLKSFNGWMA